MVFIIHYFLSFLPAYINRIGKSEKNKVRTLTRLFVSAAKYVITLIDIGRLTSLSVYILRFAIMAADLL